MKKRQIIIKVVPFVIIRIPTIYWNVNSVKTAVVIYVLVVSYLETEISIKITYKTKPYIVAHFVNLIMYSVQKLIIIILMINCLNYWLIKMNTRCYLTIIIIISCILIINW